MRSFSELLVYQKAFCLAMAVFEITKNYPKEEIYSLVSQIRRSSRGTCSAIAEGYRKRLYPQHFITKISDADMENSETKVWVEFSLACGYITHANASELSDKIDEIGKLLGYMIQHPEKFCH